MQPELCGGPTKPFLRWAGSKRNVLSKLKSYLPEKIDRYLEPFAGSACLFFDIAPRRAVLSDLNEELIETFAAVRDNPEGVGSILAGMPASRADFYAIRSHEPAKHSHVERAARFIYLNRFCFNGLYRTNAKGQFNVPYGKPKTHSVPTIQDLQRCARLLKRARLETGDFEKVVKDHVREGDLVYLDPPFFQRAGRVFRQYTATPFCGADLARLRDLLKYIDASGATFVVSYASCREAAEAFSGWSCHTIRTHRNISGFARYRRMSREIIVTNSRQLLST